MSETNRNCQHTQHTIGIDVAKRHLDVVAHTGTTAQRFANEASGIAKLIDWLGQRRVAMIVAEATGGLELALLISLHDAGYTVARVNPRWIKDFARARGKRAKTDALDAALIAAYGHIMQPQPWQPLDEDGWTFKDLCARRRQLITMVTMETNRSQQCRNAHLARQHRRLIQTLRAQIKETENVLAMLIERSHVNHQKAQIICSVPGVAQTTAVTLIADLPELGHLSTKQIASLTGLAPFNNQSGTAQGTRRIFGGRAHVRKALYMVAVGMAGRNNQHFKRIYQKLVDAGKPKKVALVAIMRKLIVTLNAMIRTNTAWRQSKPA